MNHKTHENGSPPYVDTDSSLVNKFNIKEVCVREKIGGVVSGV